MTAKVKIEADTAKYYLNLEVAFGKICEELMIDPDVYLENFQSITRSFDVSKRYTYRCDLHDAWEAVVAKRPYNPTRKGNSARVSDHTLESIKRGSSGKNRSSS